MSAADLIMGKARALIRSEAPYLASLMYGLVPYETEEVPTMATTDHMVLLYNPTWVASLDYEVAAGVLMHECSHVFRDHLARFHDLPELERYTANVAMDIALNPDLLAAGWKLTPEALLPSHYNLPNGQTAEWYYAELKKQQNKSGKGGGSKAPPDGSSKKVCSGCCGGAASNAPNGELESKANSEDGRSEQEQQRIIQVTAAAIRQAVQEGRGRIPQTLKEMANALNQPPKVDWRLALSQIVRKATGKIRSGGVDFSLRRPSKRSFTRGILRPGLIQKTPEICIIRDTSGSMGEKQINDAITESTAIVKAAGVDALWFLDADANVAKSRRVRTNQEFKSVLLEVCGRGGTDFRPAIQACQALKPRPDITIYVTDGDGFAGPAPNDMEFIWCVVPSYYNRRPAKWGHCVIISETKVVLSDPL